MAGEVEGTDLERMAHVDPGALQNYHQDSLGGSAGESRTGASRNGSGGKERWRSWGVSDCEKRQSPWFENHNWGFQTESSCCVWGC